ncbi:MAG: ATP-dependent Clp protease adaptor ClpS [Gemmataceae bacterium]|nr:ATP-dependent Clp protease adaptor ClpS [Gemmataceae bacterium]
MSDTITLPARPDVEREERVRRQPPYNVILLDDDHHTFEYVIVMLHQLFGHPPEKGYQMACEVNDTGRVIVLTTTREHAELKQEQIHAFGPDPLSAKCEGSMTAIIEPAY